MAKKKRVRRKGLSSPAPVRRKVMRRRRRSRGLSDIMTPQGAMASAKDSGAGCLGGYASYGLNRMIPSSWGLLARLAIAFGGGMGASALLNMPNTGAGFAGGMTALAFQQNAGRQLQEDADFMNEDELMEMPLFLDEDGEPMAMDEDGDMRYLSDEEKSLINLSEYVFVEG